jgi:acyl-CoA hydrolase
MDIKTYIIHRHVKGQDLNHHGTLFAGRGAEWFVEAGLIAASILTAPERIVCVNIHGMVFAKPARAMNTGCIGGNQTTWSKLHAALLIDGIH